MNPQNTITQIIHQIQTIQVKDIHQQIQSFRYQITQIPSFSEVDSEIINQGVITFIQKMQSFFHNSRISALEFIFYAHALQLFDQFCDSYLQQLLNLTISIVEQFSYFDFTHKQFYDDLFQFCFHIQNKILQSRQRKLINQLIILVISNHLHLTNRNSPPQKKLIYSLLYQLFRSLDEISQQRIWEQVIVTEMDYGLHFLFWNSLKNMELKKELISYFIQSQKYELAEDCFRQINEKDSYQGFIKQEMQAQLSCNHRQNFFKLQKIYLLINDTANEKLYKTNLKLFQNLEKDDQKMIILNFLWVQKLLSKNLHQKYQDQFNQIVAQCQNQLKDEQYSLMKITEDSSLLEKNSVWYWFHQFENEQEKDSVDMIDQGQLQILKWKQYLEKPTLQEYFQNFEVHWQILRGIQKLKQKIKDNKDEQLYRQEIKCQLGI